MRQAIPWLAALLLFACDAALPETQQAECHIPGTHWSIATTRFQPTKFVGVQYPSIQLLENGNPVASRQLDPDLDWFAPIGVFQVSATRVNVVAGYDTVLIDLPSHVMRRQHGRLIEGELLGGFERERASGGLIFNRADPNRRY